MLQNSGRPPPRDAGDDLHLSSLGGGSTATLLGAITSGKLKARLTIAFFGEPRERA